MIVGMEAGHLIDAFVVVFFEQRICKVCQFQKIFEIRKGRRQDEQDGVDRVVLIQPLYLLHQRGQAGFQGSSLRNNMSDPVLVH
jgi:hypothetical protein